jgi:hypothetical protein
MTGNSRTKLAEERSMVQTNQNDAGCTTIEVEDDRTGTSIETLRRPSDHLFRKAVFLN